MDSQRVSHCLLFFAFVIANHYRRPVQEWMPVLRLDPRVKLLADSVAA